MNSGRRNSGFPARHPISLLAMTLAAAEARLVLMIIAWSCGPRLLGSTKRGRMHDDAAVIDGDGDGKSWVRLRGEYDDHDFKK